MSLYVQLLVNIMLTMTSCSTSSVPTDEASLLAIFFSFHDLTDPSGPRLLRFRDFSMTSCQTQHTR